MSEQWWQAPCKTPDADAEAQARHHQAQLTKPAGALGLLESVAIRLAALQGKNQPQIQRPWMSVFAGDHGVAAEGISAYPQAVTVSMLRNFVTGGAAVSVLAKAQGIPLDVVDLGTVDAHLDLPSVQHVRLGLGTANFLHQPAMTEAQCQAALAAGQQSVLRALAQNSDLFLAGELGIGNTTVAAALACALTGLSPEQLAGPGSGLTETGVQHKQRVIAQALQKHQAHIQTPWEALRHLGGFELAALSGAYIACAQEGLPAVVDGFICTAAALCAVRLNPEVKPWLLFAHQGAEPGHKVLLAQLGAEPLLDLGLRLGEGSAAALAVPLIQLACTLHNKMATFSEAAVPEASA